MSDSSKAKPQAQRLQRPEKLEGLSSKQALVSRVRIRLATEGPDGRVEAAGLEQGQSYPARREDTVPLGPTSQRRVSDAKMASWEIRKTVGKRFSSWNDCSPDVN